MLRAGVLMDPAAKAATLTANRTELATARARTPPPNSALAPGHPATPREHQPRDRYVDRHERADGKEDRPLAGAHPWHVAQRRRQVNPAAFFVQIGAMSTSRGRVPMAGP